MLLFAGEDRGTEMKIQLKKKRSKTELQKFFWVLCQPTPEWNPFMWNDLSKQKEKQLFTFKYQV